MRRVHVLSFVTDLKAWLMLKKPTKPSSIIYCNMVKYNDNYRNFIYLFFIAAFTFLVSPEHFTLPDSQ